MQSSEIFRINLNLIAILQLPKFQHLMTIAFAETKF